MLDLVDSFTVLDEEWPRHAAAVACPCGGYADKVDTTEKEDALVGCGARGCCCGAYKCRICGRRLIARFPAPEMD